LIQEIDKFREGAWDTRAKYISVAGENFVLGAKQELKWDEMVSTRSPGVAGAIRLVQGDYLTACAWEVRGSGFAYTITPEAGVKFKAILEESRNAYLDAASMDPIDPTLYVFADYRYGVFGSCRCRRVTRIVTVP
jgi:hypothetical protein